MVASLLLCICVRGKGSLKELLRDEVSKRPLPPNAAKKPHLGSYSRPCGDTAAMPGDEDVAGVRKKNINASKQPDAHRPAQKIIERRKSVEGKDSQRQHSQIISCPYSRPCGDMAQETADSEGTMCVCGYKTKFPQSFISAAIRVCIGSLKRVAGRMLSKAFESSSYTDGRGWAGPRNPQMLLTRRAGIVKIPAQAIQQRPTIGQNPQEKYHVIQR